jgi:hypothetical protein
MWEADFLEGDFLEGESLIEGCKKHGSRLLVSNGLIVMRIGHIFSLCSKYGCSVSSVCLIFIIEVVALHEKMVKALWYV